MDENSRNDIRRGHEVKQTKPVDQYLRNDSYTNCCHRNAIVLGGYNMKSRWLNLVIFLLASAISLPIALADNDGQQFPRDASFTTLTTTPRPIEGLTGDHN